MSIKRATVTPLAKKAESQDDKEPNESIDEQNGNVSTDYRKPVAGENAEAAKEYDADRIMHHIYKSTNVKYVVQR